MIAEILIEAKQRMQKSIEALKHEFAKMRSGRAHPSLLDHVMVNYYGNQTLLNQVASVTVEDARTLVISPWEKSMVSAIEKAILTADLGLNPATSGTVLRVPLPALTEERRKEMVKIVRNEAESARVSIRNIRRDANSSCKELLKEKEITQDEAKQGEDDIQKLTNDMIKEVDRLLEIKEKDLLAF